MLLRGLCFAVFAFVFITTLREKQQEYHLREYRIQCGSREKYRSLEYKIHERGQSPVKVTEQPSNSNVNHLKPFHSSSIHSERRENENSNFQDSSTLETVAIRRKGRLFNMNLTSSQFREEVTEINNERSDLKRLETITSIQKTTHKHVSSSIGSSSHTMDGEHDSLNKNPLSTDTSHQQQEQHQEPTIPLISSTSTPSNTSLPSFTSSPRPHHRRWIPTRPSHLGSNHVWKEFMRTYAKLHAKLANTTNKVMYLKRGTTGIAGQMIGVCDALLVALTTNRGLQFYSDILTDDYFSFPFPNLFIRLNKSQEQQARTHFPPSFSTPYKYIITGDDKPDRISNPSIMLRGFQPVLVNSLHVMADRIVGRKVNLDFMKRAGLVRSSLSLPENRMQLYAIVDLYYNRCVHSLFQPTPRIQAYVEEYERELGEGIRIGVHIRMGSGHSDWNDSRPFMTMKRVEELMNALEGFIRQQRKKHGEAVPIRVFVSTDSSEIEKMMRKRFPKLVVTTQKLKRSHVGGVKSTKYDDSSVVKAILDVMLLGKCEFLFLTKRSGYSKIGLYYADEHTSFRVM